MGEVRETSAVVWGRCSDAAMLRVAVDAGAPLSLPVSGERDFTGRIVLHGLEPGTGYRYRAWCAAGARDSSPVAGEFRTAPARTARVPVRFAWGGDVGGQNVCRDAKRGYPIFDTISARHPDFFIGLGDMVYADDVCAGAGRYGNPQVPGPPPAPTLDAYRSHWRYNRDDPALRGLLASTGYYAVWDDHEVVDDAGPHEDTRSRPPWQPDQHLMPLGRTAFLDYSPMSAEPSGHLYRAMRWGRHLELFILDTRQYRDANAAEDSVEHPKSLLGAEQRAWLAEAIAASDATWKVVVTSVPLSLPTGAVARDGWADHGTRTGFERELAGLLDGMRTRRARNLVWITTDVHFAAVLRHRPFADDPEFVLHEIATGPLHAGIGAPGAVDQTLRPELLFAHAPAVPAAVTTLDQALGWFNFGLIQIDAGGALVIEIVDARGATRYRLALAP